MYSENKISRRQWVKVVGLSSILTTAHATPTKNLSEQNIKFCLNTATIRGYNLPIEKEIEIVAQAGYQAIEPWMDRLHEYVKRGKDLKELAARISDLGLSVESAISFPTWIVNDPQRRNTGLEQLKRDMELLAQIGGKRIAAPAAGVSPNETIEIEVAAERYYEILQIGRSFGVIPQIEMWAGNSVIGKLSTAVAILVECGDPNACLLADLFHIYRSKSSFHGLGLLSKNCIQVFHLNDYPEAPPEKLRDQDRLMPGDGVGPVVEILKIFLRNNYCPVLSLELFNPKYWQMDPLEVAKLGLKKMKSCVEKAFRN